MAMAGKKSFVKITWTDVKRIFVFLLKGQSNEIFYLQFLSSFELAWATDQWPRVTNVSIFAKFLPVFANVSIKTDSPHPQYHTGGSQRKIIIKENFRRINVNVNYGSKFLLTSERRLWSEVAASWNMECSQACSQRLGPQRLSWPTRPCSRPPSRGSAASRLSSRLHTSFPWPTGLSGLHEGLHIEETVKEPSKQAAADSELFWGGAHWHK